MLFAYTMSYTYGGIVFPVLIFFLIYKKSPGSSFNISKLFKYHATQRGRTTTAVLWWPKAASTRSSSRYQILMIHISKVWSTTSARLQTAQLTPNVQIAGLECRHQHLVDTTQGPHKWCESKSTEHTIYATVNDIRVPLSGRHADPFR